MKCLLRMMKDVVAHAFWYRTTVVWAASNTMEWNEALSSAGGICLVGHVEWGDDDQGCNSGLMEYFDGPFMYHSYFDRNFWRQ